MSTRLSRFQRFSVATTIATYLLILVGALVRASGSGLGCPDWPRCFGGWVPPTSAAELPPGFNAALFNVTQTWIEYLNRLLGVAVGLLIFATLIVAIRNERHRPRILWTTVAAFLLVGFEGWLGSIVVKEELATWTVTVHLIGALAVVSLLLYATFIAFAARVGDVRVPPALARRGRAFVVALTALLLGQIALGTTVRGGVETARMTTELTRGEWLGAVGRIDIVHRQASVLFFFAALALLYWAWRRRDDAPRFFFTVAVSFGLTATQIVIGLVLAYLGLPAAAQVLHLTAASLMLGALTWAWLTLRR